VQRGRGGGSRGEEGRRPTAVEFYSSSVLKELNVEEEMGQCRFSGGREAGMTARFGLALHARRRAAIGSAQHGGAAGGAAVLMEAGGGSRWRDENGLKAMEAAT
jgi:hypothetical protein